MASDPETLQPLQPLLRQLREIKGVVETRPGTFQLRGKTFVRVVPHPLTGALQAEVLKPGGSGVDRLPLGSPAAERKVVDEAKLRAKRLDDDD